MPTILVVDDRSSNREFLVTLLGYKDYRVLEAADGAAALALVHSEQPNLVICDLLMPTMDGYEFVRQLRTSPVGSAVPVIFYSAKYHQEELGPIANDLGEVLFLAKPTPPELILQTIEKMLSSATPYAAAAISGEFDRAHLRLLTDKLASQVEKLEGANNRLSALLALGQSIALERDPLRMLQGFCPEACKITGASYAAIAVLGEDRQTFSQFFTSQATKETAVKAPPVDKGLLSELLQKGGPVRLRGLQKGGDIVGCPPGTSTLMCLPLATPTWVYGLLYFTNKLTYDEFTAEDEQVATTLAAQLAVSYENARRFEEIKQHAVALAHEVDERRQAQAEAQRKSEEVTKAKVLEGLLRQRAEHLVEANRAKDEFLAVVSHELRTPLTSMLGWSDILRNRQVDAKTHQHGLEVIERNTRVQIQLIEDLLDISRIISGKMMLTVSRTSLIPIIEAAVEVSATAAAKKNIQVECYLATDVPMVDGDPNRLQQIVHNLLSNAIKFTPKLGRITLTLSHSESQATLSVADTGIGIEPDFLPYVFDRFRQADTTSARHYQGLGLGLAIVRHLVEQHGGTVAVQSAGKGLGSTFLLSLPLASSVPAAVADGAEVPPPAPIPEIQTHCLEGLTVLLVEDQLDSHEVLSSMLRQAGLTVIGAHSAEEALALMDQSKPDLLVSDIGLPGEDGFALIRKLRGRPAQQGGTIPAIALTAYARTVDRSQTLASGFQGYLSKPVERSALLATISNVVANLASTSSGKSAK